MSQSKSKPPSLIYALIHHKVAANLLMILLLGAGLVSISKINFRFFPVFSVDAISITVPWPGSNAEDVESSITSIVEREVRTLDNIKKMTSTASNNLSVTVLEYKEGTDMGEALDKVKEQISRVTSFPSDTEEPQVSLFNFHDTVAKMVISTEGSVEELRPLVKQFERELLDRGISKINIVGLPEKEIAIQVSTLNMVDLGLSIRQIADKVGQISRDIPAGEIGNTEATRRLRTQDQKRGEGSFADLILRSNQEGEHLRLGDIATISEREQKQQISIYYQGREAVEFTLKQTETSDSLEMAKIMNQWLDETRPNLPQSIKIDTYKERWKWIRDRLNMLLKNGASGLVLVVLILFLFLNFRVAFWVAVGIPTSFMATIAIVYGIGGSINMISMFGLIMSLGIIVDDAIVVGEDATAHFQKGERPSHAVEGAAMRMFAPVVSSSLTTIATFLPLMIIGGVIGKILIDLPVIVVCVIIASLFESFLILPGHLRHGMRNMNHDVISPVRQKLDGWFNYFRDKKFRKALTWSVNHRGITLALIVSSLIVGIGAMKGGRLAFSFFPSPEGDNLTASYSFVSGTPKSKVNEFSNYLNQILEETEKHFGQELVKIVVANVGRSGSANRDNLKTTDQVGMLYIELISADNREVRMANFIKEWKSRIKPIAGLESLNISEIRQGPPGSDVDLQILGADVQSLKQALNEAKEYIGQLNGVLSVEDNLPYGQDQIIYSLNADGKSLGLTTAEISSQLRAAYDGAEAQVYTVNEDEIEVNVILPEVERAKLSSLDDFMIILQDGHAVRFMDIVELGSKRGFDVLRHFDGKLSASISTEINQNLVVPADVIDQLNSEFLPDLQEKYNVTASFEGKNAEERETLGDMLTGLVIAFVLMYIILAWVFGSYGWPLVVMSAIPFGLVGAIGGHLWMGIDLTILSLFGLFGLSGIVVNDSIILVTFYKSLRQSGMEIQQAVIEATCQRLRAVLLTSFTTIAGLLPLLFETSLQAKFLIPMAVSISFGLAFATLLVLFFIPALLSLYENSLVKVKIWLS